MRFLSRPGWDWELQNEGKALTSKSGDFEEQEMNFLLLP
jgi:hypothetical protein